MHSLIYITVCAVSMGAVFIFGIPKETSMIIVSASAVALIGVPHGGLDHWIGRRLLQSRFERGWWIVFFPTYLAIGIAVAFGWFVMPTITVVLFFLASAWHFGREDQQAERLFRGRFWQDQLPYHLAATAIGGLVIWVPAFTRPEEFRMLLSSILPTEGDGSANEIVAATRSLACCFIPLAFSIVAYRLAMAPTDLHQWVPTVTVAVAVGLPILLSFSLYFCAWHSWQGLQRLRRHENLSTLEFVRSVAPLSVSAIVGVAVMGWLGERWLADLLIGDQSWDIVGTLFIGLSSIAVPHLILHELDSFVIGSQAKREVCI